MLILVVLVGCRIMRFCKNYRIGFGVGCVFGCFIYLVNLGIDYGVFSGSLL